MTKEQYLDFCLRYRGCGACFPIYEKLNRFEKLWFTAIQKDYTDLEKENAELKENYRKRGEVIIRLERQIRLYIHSDQLTKAKEILRGLYFIIQSRIDYENNTGIADEMWRAKQFLSEVEK